MIDLTQEDDEQCSISPAQEMKQKQTIMAFARSRLSSGGSSGGAEPLHPSKRHKSLVPEQQEDACNTQAAQHRWTRICMLMTCCSRPAGSTHRPAPPTPIWCYKNPFHASTDPALLATLKSLPTPLQAPRSQGFLQTVAMTC